MKKTAIQELINELNEESQNWSNQYYWHCLMTIIEMAESKLPQEKQDLIDAHYIGQKQLMNEETDQQNAVKYFNQTFEL